MRKLLIVDNDKDLHRAVQDAFDGHSIEVLPANDSEAALEAIRVAQPDVALIAIGSSRASGLELFHQIQSIDCKLPLIFLSDDSDSDTAIEAMKLGGYDYLLKPLDVEELRKLVHRAFAARRMMQQPVEIPTEPEVCAIDHLVGRSPLMQDVYKAIGRVATQDVTVLVLGESGTGKELVARAICHHSPRRDAPFLAVNCAALPDSLLESELFGHEKGAFTGADRQRVGKFEQCSGGTIFLDEIGDMSPLVQSKVLRLLQQQRFERVGGNKTITTDVRIIAATNCDLSEFVRQGKFREDLYYRLHGFAIELPPLRARGDDIALLLEHFLAVFSHELDRQDVEGISPDAVELLVSYPWPGNVRELQSVLRQAILSETGPVIVPESLPSEIRRQVPSPRSQTRPRSNGNANESDLAPLVDASLADGRDDLYSRALETMERYLITRALEATGGNQTQAAKLLGITRGKVANRIKTFGIELEQEIHCTK